MYHIEAHKTHLYPNFIWIMGVVESIFGYKFFFSFLYKIDFPSYIVKWFYLIEKKDFEKYTCSIVHILDFYAGQHNLEHVVQLIYTFKYETPRIKSFIFIFDIYVVTATCWILPVNRQIQLNYLSSDHFATFDE